MVPSPRAHHRLHATTAAAVAALITLTGAAVPSPSSAAAPSVAPAAAAAPRGQPATVIAPDGGRRLLLPAGRWRPYFPGKDEPPLVDVAAFWLDETPVTVSRFAAFVRAHSAWQRGRAPALFADASYLRSWRAALDPGDEDAGAPVRDVSWFAARAYCRWAGGRLPSLAEWERAAGASASAEDARDDLRHQARILAFYGRPTPKRLPRVGQGEANAFGVRELHGLVWEWVEDFATALVTGESRADAGLDRGLFCGAGSIGSADPRDYAAFMRFALRASLRGRDTGRALGFRCAADVRYSPPTPRGAP